MTELFYSAVVLFIPGVLMLLFPVTARSSINRRRKIRLAGCGFSILGALMAVSSFSGSPQGVCSMSQLMKTSSLTASLCASIRSGPAKVRMASVVVGPQRLQVEVVDTRQARARGLMFRHALGRGHGMLFIFGDDESSPFWMKNTLIPLDMLFFDRKGTLQDILRNVPPCKADPCVNYWSSLPYRYVIEINAGDAQRLGLKKGDRLAPAGHT